MTDPDRPPVEPLAVCPRCGRSSSHDHDVPGWRPPVDEREQIEPRVSDATRDEITTMRSAERPPVEPPQPLSAEELTDLRRAFIDRQYASDSDLIVARLLATLDAYRADEAERERVTLDRAVELANARAASERPPVEPLREALEWAMAPNPRHEGRHRTEPRCHVFMPIDGRCNCGYEKARAALASPAAPRPEGLDVERLVRAMIASEGVAWPAQWVREPDNFDWIARQIAAEYHGG